MPRCSFQPWSLVEIGGAENKSVTYSFSMLQQEKIKDTYPSTPLKYRPRITQWDQPIARLLERSKVGTTPLSLKQIHAPYPWTAPTLGII